MKGERPRNDRIGQFLWYGTVVKVAGKSEFKAKLSEYLAAVEAGEEVLITDRDRPVARVVRAGVADADEDEEMRRMRRLERAGVLRTGTGKLPDDFWDWPRPSDPEGLLLRALLDERRESRR